MITIFVLLGLAFLGGGIAAIVDGLPYLVLERGFTQVLGGTVAVTGGVLLLALAVVLAEVRRVKTLVTNAVMTMSMATMAREANVDTFAPVAVAESFAAPSPRLEPALAATAAGAATAILATEMPKPDERHAPDATETSGKQEPASEPDLFIPFESAAPAASPRAISEQEPARGFDESFVVEPAPWLQQDDRPATPEDEAVSAAPQREKNAAPEPDSDPFSAAIAAALEPHEVRLHSLPDGPVETPPLYETHFADPQAPEPSNEFDRLRESLARLTPPAEPQETDAAEAWTSPPVPGSADDEAPDADPMPPAYQPWPSVHELQAEALPAAPDADYAEPPQLSEPEVAQPEPDATVPPAASDEGIIGAYQVGDTHFTIFADGSIQARTNDGEYSFGSMEELKIYLASEKSRLGA